METKYNFIKMDIAEFESYISNLHIARTVTTIQEHHTYSPSYAHFKNDNHFTLQNNMKNYHVVHNGWSDIGQHFTTFPDGKILTGRSIESSPACIYGNNAHSVCIENLGNFDIGADSMTNDQRNTIVRMTAALCKKFGLPANTDKIVYHHWFNLSTGERNNGTENNKSCPGTNFFGGNKVINANNAFIPLVSAAIVGVMAVQSLLRYACVTADLLNVRTGPDVTNAEVQDRGAATLGSILRVYEENNGWLRISSSEQHWVNGSYTTEVKRGTIKADKLNVRTGPSVGDSIVNVLLKDAEVFIFEESNGWYRIALQDWWVKKDFVKQ